jgi:aflatoxin B1 aldehyde reductase
MSGLKVAFGGAAISPGRAFGDEKTVNELLDLLEKKGCKIIDSAQLYPGSEKLLGEFNAGARFTIDTKWGGGFAPGMLATKVIVDSTKTSLETLNMEKGKNE